MSTNVPERMNPLTNCLIRVVLSLFNAGRIELDVAVDLLAGMIACDREHRSEQ